MVVQVARSHNRRMGFGLALTMRGYCSACRTGISQYGPSDYQGRVSCGFHAKLLVTQDEIKVNER